MRVIDDFENKTIDRIEKKTIKLCCGKEVPIYCIDSTANLVQFVGYCKYVNSEYNVYIRGQNDLYDGKLIPSLFRGNMNPDHAFHSFCERRNTINKKYFSKYDKRIFEALIQHYGIKTTQIDVVDNLWVALWFASHTFYSRIIDVHEHLFAMDSHKDFGYIILLASDAITATENQKGIYTGENTRIIDLRKALPSFFLRPHAQHAYMLSKKTGEIIEYKSLTDYTDLVVGIAQIPTDVIQKWIGNSELLSVNSLFPSACFDDGFELLLRKYPRIDHSVIQSQGSIQIISS